MEGRFRTPRLPWLSLSIAAIGVLICAFGCTQVQAQSDSTYEYTRGPVPMVFQMNESYPARSETDECRPIRLRIQRNSRLFRTLVVNTNSRINFTQSDTRIMTSRLQTRLNALAELYYQQYRLRITVTKSWTEYGDGDVDDPQSLHYEGRTVRVIVVVEHISAFLRLAVQVGFDWVYFTSHHYLRLSVIPDRCDANVDMVFMLDQSGSVGRSNHNTALSFIQNVVSFFNISQNATQVGLVTFSSGATIRFDLDDYQDIHSLQDAIGRVRYTGGLTTTAIALILTRHVMDPSRNYGARPSSVGVPKVAILLTDGRSNYYSITDPATNLRRSGVQVYTVGIGNIYLPELRFIASDPDPLHVFLLNSFNSASRFVDFLSYTTCDAPAIVEPGDNTTTEVEEDEFRFFQSECAAFSLTIMIEQIDLVGRCSLYASSSVQNPGPLSSPGSIVRNEDRSVRRRSVLLTLAHIARRFVYVSVRGLELHNTFSVIIWDMIFNEDQYTVNVQEGVRDVAIFNLTDQLKITNVTFNYTITDGNEYNFFEVDPQTGILYVRRELNADTHTYFWLTIVAQNSVYSCHRGRVKVKIIVIRDRIVFPDLPTVSVLEDATTGSFVTQVQVSGNPGVLEYSITSGNNGNAFRINSTSGNISVDSPLDFETQSSYSLTISARIITTGMSGTATQMILVLDVNEPPFFTTQCATSNSCVFTVFENEQISTFVGRTTADDPDLSTTQNGMLLYALVPTSVPFQITQTGRLRTTAELDREDVDRYTFDVVVHDLGSPQLSVVTTVTVNVGDRNEYPPVFIQAPPVIVVRENTDVGTILEQFIATDNDTGTNAEIIYSIRLTSTRGPLPIEINPQSGEIEVSGVIDFENITFYTIEVNASNPDGLSTLTTSVVTVKDLNDNPPVFSQDLYTGEVVEHAPAGTAIMTVVATDRDSPAINGNIRFSIISGNFRNYLEIDQVSGTIGLLSTATEDIDRETIQVFNLTVEAHDLGSPTMFDFTQVLIRVTDVNDNPPIFSPSSYSARIREDAAPPQEVLQVFATDRDESGNPNSEIRFEITMGNVNNLFTMNITTGALTLIGQLDFETQPSYELLITALDQGVPQMNGTAIITIEVININDVPPDVSGNQTIEVSESTPVLSVIAMVNASDLDQMGITFTIVSTTGNGGASGSADGIFQVDSNGRVILLQELDYETNQNYTILIQVSDGQLMVYTSLVVNVIDENDSPPVFSGATLFRVTEEQPAGTLVGTVQATDLDSGTNAEIVYSILTDTPAASLFSIGASDGQIRTTQVLDREVLVERDLFLPSSSSTAVIRIQAHDLGIPAMVTVSSFSIQLSDINDNQPMFELTAYQTMIYENLPAPTTVFQILAMDSDLGVNAQLTYSLVLVNSTDGTTAPFSINASGFVQTTAPLNREEQDEYTLIITATDGGSPPMSSDVTGTVVVLDLNDNAPEFNPTQYETSVLENAVVLTPLVPVFASDADAGTNADVVYSIENDFNLFFVDPTSGLVSLVGTLDFETRNSYTLTLIARDSGTPSLFSTAEVIVNVQNVDETPPTFLGPCNSDVFENVPPDTPIALCVAVDFDEVTNVTGTSITYAILNGNNNNTFRISSNGDIFTVRMVDREQRDLYMLTISATDPAGLSTTLQVNITILDVNDNSPQFSNLPITVSVTAASIASYSTEVTTVRATDADIGSNAELRYSITQTTQMAGNMTQVTVEVSDGGSPSLSTTANINVRFESACAVQQFTINATTGVVTGQYLCSVSVEPLVANVTLGGSQQFFCRIVRNIDPTYQWLQNGSFITAMIPLSPQQPTGDLLVFSVMFQDAGEYACQATTIIGSLQSESATVNVQVPPAITFPPQSAAVEEGRSVQFICFGTGIPPPTYSWHRPTSTGGEIDVEPSSRVVPAGPLLQLSEVQDGDQGNYTCAATNPAGVDRASTRLVIFGLPDVVVVEVMNYSSPNANNTCHEFNATQFDGIMAGITSHTTMTTNQSGDSLCNTSACSPNPCRNNASCGIDSNIAGGYVCNCTTGYTGPNCDQNIDECLDDPCQFGGTCMDTDGSFSCACADGFTGHRCQYSSICETQPPCPSNLTCVATVTNVQGYVCQEVSMTGSVVVTDSATSPSLLDEEVNSLLETQESSNTQTRRRRQANTNTDNPVVDNNGFVTTCEARFIQAPDSGSYILVWVCPEGVAEPSLAEQEEVCQLLFDRGLVTSCTSPTGVTVTRPTNGGTQLPDTTLHISFILLDSSSGAPLSSSSVLAILQDTNALARLRAQGYEATGFTSATPQTETTQSNTGDIVAGAIIGALFAAVVVTVVVAAIVAVLCYTRKKKSKALCRHLQGHDNGQVCMSMLRKSENVYEVNPSKSPEDLICTNPYIQISSPSLVPPANQSENTFTFASPHTLSASQPDQVFDDSTNAAGYRPPPLSKNTTPRHQYQPPTTQTTPKKTSTLERAAGVVKERVSSLRRRTESSSNLLDGEESGDYDEVVVDSKRAPPSVPPKPTRKNSRTAEEGKEDDETIYGNIQHQRLGAMGNAGERWESYWKTQTLLKTADQQESPKK